MEGQQIIQLYSEFQNHFRQRQRIRIKIDEKFQGQLDMMEYLILSKFQKNTKSIYKQKKNRKCDKEFKRGFKELLDSQKVYYYNMIVTHLENISNQDLTPPEIQTESLKAPGYSKTYSKIGWKEVLLKLDNEKRYLYVEKSHKLKAYNLNLFLLRKSKTVDYNSFVLEAIDASVSEKQQQLHIGFKDVNVFKIWFQAIKKIVEFVFWQKIRNMLFPPEIVEILANKSYEPLETISKKSQLIDKDLILKNEQKSDTQSNKMYASQLKSKSHDFLSNQEQNNKRMFQSGLSRNRFVSQNESDQKSMDEKSIQSIEVNSQRSSVKTENQMIECHVDDEGEDQTFRSIALLGIDEVESQSDGMIMFRKLLPDYSLDTISDINSRSKLVHSSDELQIYSFQNNSKHLKVFLTFPKSTCISSIEKFASLLCTPQYYKLLNPEIQELQSKTILKTDNCLILYQKNKPYNRMYRSRDFVFVRHIFSPINSKKYYIVDKSVQDTNIPPFTTIVRGQLIVVYQIFEESGKVKINIDVKIQNIGYLKDVQQLNLNIRFFKGFQGFAQKLKNINKENVCPIFQLPEKVEKKPQKGNQNMIQVLVGLSKADNDIIESGCQQKEKITQITEEKDEEADDQQRGSKHKSMDSDSPLSFHKAVIPTDESVQTMQFQGQISTMEPKQLFKAQRIIRKFDNSGYVIISQDYLSKYYQIEPLKNTEVRFLQGKNNQHPIWKGNWQFPTEGGLKFINQKQIDDQKGVLKFILSQVAKNLVSGKSILNISLPVDIFSAQSNLQRFIFSMSYAPILLQPALKMSPIDRFLNTVIFGMTNSPLYLQMEKPFNPILGETFQCSINGCPAYAEQISHHPPVAAFMLVGRGYVVSAQIQSKMKLNINSGAGSNYGVYRIKFDDGEEICYMSPSGEVSGLAYGDRRFNMIGKAYGWSQKSGLFIEIVLNPKKPGFFGKQQTPIDYFQGRIFQVGESFFRSFSKSLSGLPKRNQIIRQQGKFHGRWDKQLFYENKLLFSYDTSFPLQLDYEQSPLPSDSNWRQDIAYRRIMQISSAQVWKQRLEIQQRNQRKLRQKYGKK